ncbi:M28 family peptidase [Sulfidibacter corallicola]|uniref:M28 family peptidase n=1 Tax=Sulfidibacter corallicola TaxID=2818388 RepID=A0A8A4TPE2_SULCO|nr:M28 family peptidase [Sulfidibacter corallicola]QTD50838.1 M28 family peptidase [Sulfidibacter corallicola]
MMKWLLVVCMGLLMACGSTPPSASNETAHEKKPEPAATPVTKELIEKAAGMIDAKRIEDGVKILAHDDMMGRATGTEGERKAAEWIAAQYESIGLKPLAGDSFFQKVQLIGMKKNAETSSLTLRGDKGELKYENGKTLTWWSTAQKEKVAIEKAPLVFVGYGVDAPEHQWDDYKGLDAKGKILVFLNNDPDIEGEPDAFGGEARTYYGRYTYKFEQAMSRGAAGAIIIHTTHSAGYGWEVIGTSGSRESFAVKLPDTGFQLDMLAWMHQDLVNQIAAMVGSDLDAWFKAANKRDFQPVPLPVTLDATMEVALRETEGQNVVGLWEGSDPTLKDEIVIFSAHYDHLGVKDDGSVYNGAWDNALGTAAIIDIARAFAESGLRPRRSIAFLACSAEERGLLGSFWFTANPPVPLKRFVANLNIDMPQILGMTHDIGAIGYESNSLGEVLQSIAAETPVTLADGTSEPMVVKGDPNPNAGSFYRSDQANFVKAGVPAIYFVPGKSYVETPSTDPSQYHTDHYHKVSDVITEHWDLSGCVRDMRVILRLTTAVAMADEMPRWQPGNEFEGAWKKLHGR